MARDGSIVTESEDVEFHGIGDCLRTDGSNSREVNQRIQGFRHAATARAASGWKWTLVTFSRRKP